MLKPAYRIQIGSEAFEPGPRTPVISVKVNLDMDVPADSFEILLGEGNTSAKIAEGDEVSIQLGYEGSLEAVMAGRVDHVEPDLAEVRVTGLDSAAKLLVFRADQLYESQSAGGIVSDLANKAGVSAGEIADGLSFAMYVIDHRKNAYEHMFELAEKCGFDIYMTPASRLVFKAYERVEPHVLAYGKEVIHAELQEETPRVVGVVVHGESPSSFKGADTSHWLTKRAVEGVAGSGVRLVFQEPTVRDKDAAEKVAKARLAALARGMSGGVTIVGKAEIKLGDTIEIRGMTNSKMNGVFQVRSVEHYLSKTAGFTTTIGWRK
jgi:phage protein D